MELPKKEKKRILKTAEEVERDIVKRIIEQATQGIPPKLMTQEEIEKLILTKVIEKRRKEIWTTEVFAKEYLTDWLVIGFALICFISSFFITKMEVGWLFSIALIGTLAIRHPASKIIASLFTFTYFVGVLFSGYYLTLSQIWNSMLGLNTIFKWSFFFASIGSFIIFVIAVFGGAKRLTKKGLAISSLGLMAIAIICSFIDLLYQTYNYIYNPYMFFPYTNITIIFLVNSAGFFLTLSLAWGFWYIIAWGLRRIVVGKKMITLESSE